MPRWPSSPTFEEAFWLKVNKNGPTHPVLLTPCWLWTGNSRPVSEGGYGVIAVREGGRKKQVAAHRIAWTTIAGREIPEGRGVLHHCDVGLCVNYETHLFTGTQLENIADRNSKGRTAFGESSGAAKLTDAEVLELRRLAQIGWTHKKLGELFGLTKSPVRRIIARQTWKHL